MKKDPTSGYVEHVEYVDLPWGRARLVEVVSVASTHHDVSLELLEFEDGTTGLRFVAYLRLSSAFHRSITGQLAATGV